MRLWTGFVDYLVLAVLDQPECYYGTPSPREPGNSIEIAQRETERNKKRAGRRGWGQRERRDERKEKGGEREKKKERDLLPCLSLKVTNQYMINNLMT